MPVGTRTFVLTDVVGSTGLWSARPDVMAGALARHCELIDRCVRARGGLRPLEQGEGDSTLSVFERAADAVAAAVDIQLALADEPWPEGARIQVRIGLHTGDAEVRDGTSWVGVALHRCARIRGLGHGGQVLLSSATAGVVSDALPAGATLADLGEHHLRGIPRPERVHQLRHPSLAHEFPPLASDAPAASQVPSYLTSFIGRSQSLDELGALLARERCVTLTGTGGCGKTRLAREVASLEALAYEDGVHWVDLAALADPALIGPEVATAVGVTEVPTMGDVTPAVAMHLAEKHALLVVDNCEHLAGSVAELVEHLLQRCPALDVLMTSREPLGVAGEHAWLVPSLALPPAPPAPVDEVLAADAVRLFVDRAARVRGRFEVTEDNAAPIAMICRRLDGIPLALELAAARIRSLSPQEILTGLDDRFTLLTGGPRSAVARQRTLEASVTWSHDLLGHEERRLFRRLAVFAGGFTLAAAEAVCSDDDLPELAILDLLSNLVDRSLVVVDESGPVTRYEMLETLRDFARHRLHEAGEAPAVRDRHLAYYLAMVEAAEPELERDQAIAVVDRLLWDLDNIRGAMDWSLESGHVDEAQRLPGSLLPFFFFHNLLEECARRLEAVRDLEGGSLASRTKVLVGSIGGQALMFDPLSDRGDRGLAIASARELGDPRLLGRALLWSGFLGVLRGESEARALLEEAVEVCEAGGDVLYLGLARTVLAYLAILDADLHRSRALLGQAYARYGTMRCPIEGFPVTVLFQALVEAGGGDLATGWAAVRQLEMEIAGAPRSWFHSLAGVARGMLHLTGGDLASARKEFDDAMDSAVRLNNALQYALAVTYIAPVVAASGQLDEAAGYADTAVELLDAVGGSQVTTPAVLARARAAEGAADAAALEAC
ncbi:MAG TPA: AAA family ATPase, partial [Acidimicrobiales bacterium]|nr:AAA family ATPase [Acidimicrobiales bacterium]